MKRPIYVMLAMMLAVSMGAGTLLAADRGPDGDDAGKTEHSARMLDHMKKELGLSDAEAAKIKGVFEQSRKESEPLRRDLKVTLEKLRWQVDAKAGEKELSATLDQLDKDRKALAEQREKAFARLQSSLSVETRAKLALMHAERMQRMMMGHHGWGGHGWGGREDVRGRGPMPPESGPDRQGPPPPGDDENE